MKTIFNIFLFLFFTPGFLSTQVTQEWVARYTYISLDEASDITVDNSGNVYVTGRSYASNGYDDYATVKYNSAGVEQWAQRYNGPGNNIDQATSIAVDNSGSVYVTGFSRSGPDAGYNDFATIKYNTAGVQQWLRRYNGGGTDNAYKVVIDNDGNILVGGFSTQPGTGPDFTVVKYDTSGNMLWVRTYDSGSDGQYDYGKAMAVDMSGSVYLTGSVGGNNFPAPDWATVKWNSQGVFQWVQRYNGPGSGSDYPQAIAVSDSGNVYVTGYVWGNNNADYATVKYNSEGTQQWVTFYNGGSIFTAHDVAISIVVDDSGSAFVTGASTNPSFSTNDWATIKYSNAGVQQWVTRFNGPANSYDEPCCIKLDTSGNIYVTGYATVSLPVNRDYCTIKYNNSGAQQWIMYYGTSNPNSPGDEANALAVDEQSNVYVTGISMGDYATIKYSQTTGIKQISNEIPNDFKLYQNYPNPFNPMTSIRFNIPSLIKRREGVVLLSVYDILGREVATLVSEELRPGTYEVGFDCSHLSSGVYFYRLITQGFSETRKMTFLK